MVKLANKSTIGLAHRLLSSLMMTTGFAIASAPSLAATLAFADANFLIDNFSHRPNTTSATVDTNTFTNADPGSSIDTFADAYSIFLNSPAQNSLAYNTTSNVGVGEGLKYLGTTQSKAKVVGEFALGENQSFGFNFAGDLQLKTSIDTFFKETANAAGNIYFLVLDTTDSKKINILDRFLLSGNLSTPGLPDFLFAKKSSRVQFNNFSKQKSFGGKEESALGSVTGTYQRFFKKPTNITLIEVKQNSTKQEAKNIFGLADSSKLNSGVETLVSDLILSDPIVAAMGSESSELDSSLPNLSNESIVSAIGNKPYETQGSYKSSKISSGDIKSAIAKNDKVKDWLKGKTKTTALLPDKIVNDLQVFSDVSTGNWIDPPTTYGLEYKIEGDALFTNILDFFTDDVDDLFTVVAEGKILGKYSSGDSIDFVSLLGKGVSSFTITDIDPLPGNKLANFNLRPLFNTNTASLQARSFDKYDNRSVSEPGFVFSLLAFGVVGVASRLFQK